MDQFYKTKMCPFLHSGHCRKGSYCTYAHHDSELRSASNLIKTKLCPFWRKGECDDQSCPFAHGRHELQFTGDYFKTKLCRFWQQGLCLAGEDCRHAHGLQEVRPRRYRLSEREKGILSEKRLQKGLFKQELKNKVDETRNYLEQHYVCEENEQNSSLPLSKLIYGNNLSNFPSDISQSVINASFSLVANNKEEVTVEGVKKLSHNALGLLDVCSEEVATNALNEQNFDFSSGLKTFSPLEHESLYRQNIEAQSDVCYHGQNSFSLEKQLDLPAINVVSDSSLSFRFPRAASTPCFIQNGKFDPWVDTINILPAIPTEERFEDGNLEAPAVDSYNFGKLNPRNSNIFSNHSLTLQSNSSENASANNSSPQGDSVRDAHFVSTHSADVAWKTFLEENPSIYTDLVPFSPSEIENGDNGSPQDSLFPIRETFNGEELNLHLKGGYHANTENSFQNWKHDFRNLDELKISDIYRSFHSLFSRGELPVQSDILSECSPIDLSVYENWLLGGRA